LVLDEGWSKEGQQQVLDVNGRPMPNPSLYPSSANGAGFAPLVEELSKRKLKLGLWLVRGVPRTAAAAATPIAGSTFTCAEAVRFDKPCFWSSSNYGSTAPAPAALAYYASVAALFKTWGVAFVKLDCMWPNMPPVALQPSGYFDADLFAMSDAFTKAGLTISLSPGISVTVMNGTTVAQHGLGLTYRVTEDFWDVWRGADDGTFPSGIVQKFGVAAAFAALIGRNNTFPDLDMLPVGSVLHASKAAGVYGPASPTRLSRDEQRTMVSLWAIVRSPLFLGARLPLDPDDTWTLALLTNPEVLAVQNTSTASRPLPSPAPSLHAWTARPFACPSAAIDCAYAALFNAGEEASDVVVAMADVLPGCAAQVCARDLWARQDGTQPAGQALSVHLPPHGASMHLLWCGPFQGELLEGE
jgi:hypothetical protein